MFAHYLTPLRGIQAIYLLCHMVVYRKCNNHGILHTVVQSQCPASSVGGLLVSLSTLKVAVGHEIAVPGLALRFERRV